MKAIFAVMNTTQFYLIKNMKGNIENKLAQLKFPF